MRQLLLVTVMLACGTSGTSPTPTPPVDAPKTNNPTTPAIQVLSSCPSAASIKFQVNVSGAHRYEPATQNIASGDVVQFQMNAEHSAKHRVDAGGTPAFEVPFGEKQCIKFNAVGKHEFYCTAHGFRGEVVVQ